MTEPTQIGEMTFLGKLSPAYQEILTPEAVTFLTELVREFQPRLEQLLAERVKHQAAFDEGQLPGFLPETKEIREGDWKVSPVPQDLQDRRIEITGPVDRKMIINALNANVKVFMADFEDSQSPSWEGVIEGQINLRDANLRTIEYAHPTSGKKYTLKDDPALLIARVRGLHLLEKHVQHQQQSISASLFDFALYFFHNWQVRKQQGTGVYYYIPKLQSHHEAAWWSDVFKYTESRFQLPEGTIRVTALIETLPAVFEMNEILFALREHIVGLNCGRWDYIFSYIKTLRNHADRVLPDRQKVTMDQPFLSAYSRLLIKTCHRRGALAMGGMAALIPAKNEMANARVLQKVREDKELEARNGHDGTWIAHPGLADTALDVFNQFIPEDKPNQLHVLREDDPEITENDLLAPCPGECSERGMRNNIRVAIQYIEAWINGNGCVPIYGLMEDAATAEIARTSIWQWIRHGRKLDSGKTVTVALFREMLQEESLIVRQEVGEVRWETGKFELAMNLLDEITTSETLVDFLTLPAYNHLN